ncbi:MAG: site-2 protease family protein [Bacteroidota bacterium]
MTIGSGAAKDGSHFFSLFVLPVILGVAAFLFFRWSDGKITTLGILISLGIFASARIMAGNRLAKRALLRAEELLNQGDVKGAQAELAYAGPRLGRDKKLWEKYARLNDLASAHAAAEAAAVAQPVLDAPPGAAGEQSDASPTDDEAPPKLISWRGVVLLCLTPFIFTPFFRVTFPHVGLWPAALVTLLSVWILRHSATAWEEKLGRIGLALAVLAFLAAWVAAWSDRIPGPVPPFDPGFSKRSSWPIKAAELLIFIVSVILHECAHGIAAYLSGDPTAKQAGRISLNPLRHVDLFGSIILPALLTLAPDGVVFGWAKPVPVNQERYRSPRRGRLAVALAGVATNFFLAFFCASCLMSQGILLHLRYPAMTSQGFISPWQDVILRGLPQPFLWQLLISALKAGIMVNMILFSLNILPIPPLDGYGVLEGLMPAGIRRFLQKLRPIGAAIFLLLMVANLIDYALFPGLLGGLLLNYGAGAAAKLG